MSEERRRPGELARLRRLGALGLRSIGNWGTDRRTLFVIGTPRSGSSHLLDLLNSLEGVDLAGEALNPGRVFGPSMLVRGPRTAVLHLRLVTGARIGPVVGAKLLLPQMARLQLEPAELASAFDDAQFVVLYRSSLGEQYVSKLMALETRQWVSTTTPHDGTVNDRTVQVDPHRFVAYCENMRRRYRSILDVPALAERAVVVSHEAIRCDPDAVFADTLCPFLDLDPAPVTTRLVKQNQRPLAAVVSNHDEVADLLQSERLEL